MDKQQVKHKILEQKYKSHSTFIKIDENSFIASMKRKADVTWHFAIVNGIEDKCKFAYHDNNHIELFIMSQKRWRWFSHGKEISCNQYMSEIK